MTVPTGQPHQGQGGVGVSQLLVVTDFIQGVGECQDHLHLYDPSKEWMSVLVTYAHRFQQGSGIVQQPVDPTTCLNRVVVGCYVRAQVMTASYVGSAVMSSASSFASVEHFSCFSSQPFQVSKLITFLLVWVLFKLVFSTGSWCLRLHVTSLRGECQFPIALWVSLMQPHWFSKPDIVRACLSCAAPRIGVLAVERSSCLVRSFPIVCCCSMVGFFRVCLCLSYHLDVVLLSYVVDNSSSFGFQIIFRGKGSICSCKFGVFVGRDEFRIFVYHQFGPHPSVVFHCHTIIDLVSNIYQPYKMNQ